MKPHTLMQENGGSGAVQITPKLVSFAKDSKTLTTQFNVCFMFC